MYSYLGGKRFWVLLADSSKNKDGGGGKKGANKTETIGEQVGHAKNEQRGSKMGANREHKTNNLGAKLNSQASSKTVL